MTHPRIIAEIGGSSSRWALLFGDGSVLTFPLKGEAICGFNPVQGDGAYFAAEVKGYFEARCPEALLAQELIVYGAGCGTEPRRQRMRDALRAVWSATHVHVETDLMAAARGMCTDKPGLVLILGTGMNAGYFDGTQLFQPMPSLGYVLGDEGSGADIGRALLQDAFYRRMPEQVHLSLFGEDGPELSATIEGVYRSPFPAKALAAHTAMLASHLQEPYVRDLIHGRFNALLDVITTFFEPEQRAEVYATGSVAFGFSELLSEALLDRGMSLMAVEPDPLPGLVRYHERPA
jgi:N-acetylglucosamine kinase-like BadF-type ATPase